ncbi:type II toxin-antitoxin system HicA family toxin [Clostridium tertium]|uniref:type II toxin-antitoxin system HicA family toxin n=1 Tax=Clostridium tertium TaxID=1559 RepID=UPI0023B3101B|nr:type II toxin-antitoxin system HicA family toxin [Clostridium tertium]
MPKSKKIKSKRSGAQYSKHIKIINNNPILKNIKSKYISDLQDLREEILDRCLEEMDIIKEEAERKLIYDKSSELDTFKELAKNNPDKFTKTLRTVIISDDEGCNLPVYNFMKIRDSISEKSLPGIFKKATPLKATSVVQTVYEFHTNILSINMLILKHLLYDELDSTCLEYLKSYKIPDKENSKDCGNELNFLKEKPLLAFEENEESNTTREFKMRSFKELNNLAIKNGFEFARQRGDHAIFRNSNGYITVIPQRAIGKGLQIEILKQIGEY